MDKKETLDPHGFPIEMDRPVVFESGKLDPHTELSITVPAKELGFQGEGFYNVPSIYEGKIYDPQKDFKTIRQYAQKQAQSGFKFPNFPSIETAETAAKARSEYFNKVKGDMLKEAVAKQRQQLMLDMLKSSGGIR